MYGLDVEVVNRQVDPTFSFMTLDWDGKIRMDCSSPYAMAGLIDLKDRFDIAFGNDTDCDRHGIVVPARSGAGSAGLMNPNHTLAVAIWYLFQNRPAWGRGVAVGKTLVSSAMIDRVAGQLGRRLCEVPVGFKYFVDGLREGSLGFGGEESAGASFLRQDGTVWTTDKDGIILDLLAAEITARTGRDPGEHYRALESRFGSPVYERMDVPANELQRAVLANLSPDLIQATELAGEKIIARLTHAPGNNTAIGGLKVITKNGWFAARPSGTEDIYKVYAESFRGAEHLRRSRTRLRRSWPTRSERQDCKYRACARFKVPSRSPLPRQHALCSLHRRRINHLSVQGERPESFCLVLPGRLHQPQGVGDGAPRLA